MMHDDRLHTPTPRRRAGDRKIGPSVALVPIDAAARNANDVVDAVHICSVRPDPSFVTHLIAIAERCPQTRVLRRQSPQDATAAYRSVGAARPVPTGLRTRQDILL